MLSRSIKPLAVCFSGARFYYGKLIPDHKLKFVQVFHRHGDRTPLQNYFKGSEREEEENAIWKETIPDRDEVNSVYNMYKYQDVKPNVPCDPVFGQLTHNGVVQMQHVGKALKKLYMQDEQLLTPDSFDKEVVSLYSTCRDRTLHSIQSLLSSLFPVTEYKDSYPVIQVKPDDLCCLNKYDTDCKNSCQKRLSMYDWLEHEERMAEKYQKIVANAIPLFRDKEKIKWTDVMDFVITRYNHLLDIPEDVYNIFPDVYRHCMDKFRIIYNTPKCLHNFTDDLLALIKKEVDSVIDSSISTRLSIYSCHDTTLEPLLNVLSPYSPMELPKYGAYLCLEYWENEFDQSIDVAMRYNGQYLPIFIEHYVESIIVPYKEFCKTLTIPKYLLEVMRDKNKLAVLEDDA